jgi:hypothetical protein
MAGFEVVVRPVVLPAIRPTPARPAAPQDDPEKDIAVIAGLGGKLIDLAFSQSGSVSRSRLVEVRRVYDLIRMYAYDESGTIIRDVYLDIEVVTRVEFVINGGVSWTEQYAHQAYGPNVEVLAQDLVRKN